MDFLEEGLFGPSTIPLLLSDTEAVELLHALVELDALAHLLEEALFRDALASLLQTVRVQLLFQSVVSRYHVSVEVDALSKLLDGIRIVCVLF